MELAPEKAREIVEKVENARVQHLAIWKSCRAAGVHQTIYNKARKMLEKNAGNPSEAADAVADAFRDEAERLRLEVRRLSDENHRLRQCIGELVAEGIAVGSITSGHFKL